MGRLWYMGREGYADKYQKSEQDWQWYCKQAGNKQMMLFGIDQHENFKDLRYQLILNKDKYFGFFGKPNAHLNKNNRNKPKQSNKNPNITNITNIINNTNSTNIIQEDNWNTSEW